MLPPWYMRGSPPGDVADGNEESTGEAGHSREDWRDTEGLVGEGDNEPNE